MKKNVIKISQYCILHHIDISFIRSLDEEGLIHVSYQEEEGFIEETQLQELEIYTRWYHELGINPEGIDTVRHLLERIRNMQEEIVELKHRLRLYEP